MSRVLLIATGGTIASTPESDGLTPTLGGRELAERVPLLDTLCELDFVQPMNIDSTNMRPRDWLRLASVIRDAYDRYDGFVILHGTDTMAYTAAALSYLIQGSEKPIVLTGSQQPMANPFTDAKLNLYHSVLYACDEASRDVSVVFGGEVICGTRARKQRTMSFNAFTSMNYPPVAYVHGEKIVRAAGSGEAEKIERPPRFYDTLDDRVIVLKLTPELRPSIFELLAPDYDAVILETFRRDPGDLWHRRNPGPRWCIPARDLRLGGIGPHARRDHAGPGGGPRPRRLRGRARICGSVRHPARR